MTAKMKKLGNNYNFKSSIREKYNIAITIVEKLAIS